jgi:hypothetical protein
MTNANSVKDFHNIFYSKALFSKAVSSGYKKKKGVYENTPGNLIL